jgi:hypothetical protein
VIRKTKPLKSLKTRRKDSVGSVTSVDHIKLDQIIEKRVKKGLDKEIKEILEKVTNLVTSVIKIST